MKIAITGATGQVGGIDSGHMSSEFPRDSQNTTPLRFADYVQAEIVPLFE